MASRAEIVGLTGWLAGCGSGGDTADDTAPPPEIEIRSPSSGVHLSSPWAPVVVALPPSFLDATVTTWLDGRVATDPLGLLRTRWGARGSGVDYLATLDLVDLPAGPHELLVEAVRPDGTTLRASSELAHVPRAFRLDVEVIDADGRPTSARIVLLGADGPVNLAGPDAGLADPAGRDSALRSFYAIDGHGAVRLDRGVYQVIATRGIRDELAAAEVVMGSDQQVSLRIERSVPTPGVVAADLHVHTGRSADGYVPNALRGRSLLASGLDVAVLTDHYLVTDPTPLFDAIVGPRGPVLGVAGVEGEMRRASDDPWGHESIGHYNAFPFEGEVPYDSPSVGAPVGAHVAAAREQTGGGLAQLNHPRGIQFRPELTPAHGAHALFTALGFRPDLPLSAPENEALREVDPGSGAGALDWDAIELINRFSLPLYRDARRDWFALLGEGYRLTATGNSDSHSLARVWVGMTANLVSIPQALPGEGIDEGRFVEAIRAGHVAVSTGPVVSLEVWGAGGRPALPGDLVAAAEGGVRVRMTVRAASWVPVDEVRLVVDGAVVLRETIAAHEGPLWWQVERTVDLPRDGWVLGEAGWPIDGDEQVSPEIDGLYQAVAPGYVPIGFTNPVYVDVDGDGHWDPRAPAR